MNRITNFKQSDIYRNKVHDLIPGGAHTYSKGDDQFPIQSPAAIKNGKGAYVWDVDGNKYLDCSMGLTSVGLGHAYEPVTDAIKTELDNGVNFQRPASIELEMAEKFLSLVPQHDMIKFGKNGSLVITAAIKLARVKTGRKLVAFPSDHPFYSYDDWFIGRTQASAGVPEEHKALSVTFKGCDLDSLAQLFEQYPNQIACVISEPERLTCYNCNCEEKNKPQNFLHAAIELAHKHGALFIQDEMITGFKTDLPGTISKYKTAPDMATWGKGIANGFSFCALTGTKDVMELGGIRNTGAEKVFLISTTHGGETTAIAAGLSTIKEYQSKNVIAHNQKIGDALIAKCTEIITKFNLQQFIQIAPCNWMLGFTFRDNNKEVCQGMRTLMMQEMIAHGVLFQGAFVPCYSHQQSDVDFFAAAFEQSILVYKQALEDGYKKYLVGEPAKPVFRKYL
jgi:glutamate-1-semialdehyde 2,1-aminomutase